MADYRKAIVKILAAEGGYANDPKDKGGETYKGISRRSWPKWAGWPFVDFAKKSPGFPGSLNKVSGLQDMVMSFYRDNFWNPIGADGITSQQIAELLLDPAVNEGITPAIARAQKIVGLSETGVVTQELISKLNGLG